MDTEAPWLTDWYDRLHSEETVRLMVCREKIFLAHAGVTALPQVVADAVIDYTDACTTDDQERKAG